MVYAVQGEKNSRKIRFDLFQNGMAYEIDQTSSVLISYKKPDGHGGMYDVLDNGECAFEFAEDSTNSVIITLAEQVLTTVGNVHLLVSFMVGDEILSTFSILLDVSENPGIDVAESEDYFSLSAAINAAVSAAQEPVKIIEISGSDGNYTSSHTLNQIITLIVNKIPVLCYWKERQIVMHLSSYVINNFVWFSNIIDSVEYNVFIDGSGVVLNELPIALISNIPSKVSELENDRRYLTEDRAVIEVNGKTGKVELPTPLRVTLNTKEDGTYEPSMYSQPIFNSVRGLGCVVFCQYGSQIIPLVSATSAKCIFQLVSNNEITTVTIAGFSATVKTTPSASGGGGVIITDDGQGNVTITSAPATSTTDETGE